MDMTALGAEGPGGLHDVPFGVRVQTTGRAVVEFREYVDHPRMKRWEDQLAGIVSTYDKIDCDFTKTVHITSDWMRYLATLTRRAELEGRVFSIVGMRHGLRETFEVLTNDAQFLFREGKALER